jgi:large subunit ribosomal protein L20
MRVKTSVSSRRRHKSVLKRAEGFRGRRKSCFRLAKLAVQHSERNQYRDRRTKKREFRGLWIIRINAAARLNGLTYSRLMRGLKVANVEVDRKILADMAVHNQAAFQNLAERARAALV